MVTFKSSGGKQKTPAENNFEILKAGFIFLLVIGTLVAAGFGINYLINKNSADDKPVDKAACVQVIDGSIFTTGDPLMDQRILYTILKDTSKDHQTSGKIVEHIWQKKNFNFPDTDMKTLWGEANQNVTSIQSISAPALSITKGVITPYKPNQETQNLNWTEVQLSTIPAQKSTFLMVSSLNQDNVSNPVPTVILSINNARTVPAPTLGGNAKIEAVQPKAVCEEK